MPVRDAPDDVMSVSSTFPMALSTDSAGDLRAPLTFLGGLSGDTMELPGIPRSGEVGMDSSVFKGDSGPKPLDFIGESGLEPNDSPLEDVNGDSG